MLTDGKPARAQRASVAAEQALPLDERQGVEQRLRGLDRLDDDFAVIDKLVRRKN